MSTARIGGAIAPEIAGAATGMRLPRTATRRGVPTYCKLLSSVKPDHVWGGWSFEGRILRSGSVVRGEEVPDGSLLLECAGPVPGGWGHRRAPVVYILWRWEEAACRWRELARTLAVNRDWTVDLGPLAKRELEPARPVLVDPIGAANRVLATLEQELESLRPEAQTLVVRAVYDQFAARVAEG